MISKSVIRLILSDLVTYSKKWVMLRGDSYAGNLIEQYKASVDSSKGKKGLRKTLLKKQNDNFNMYALLLVQYYVYMHMLSYYINCMLWNLLICLMNFFAFWERFRCFNYFMLIEFLSFALHSASKQ